VTSCPSILMVPDGPGRPEVQCLCVLDRGHPGSGSLHRGKANGVHRVWADTQAVQRPRGGVT
jgi:hypothetical protein